MKITDLLTKETMILALQAKTKGEVIDELAEKLAEAGAVSDVEVFKQAIWAREKQSTTGVGDGIAIPHAKTAAVKRPAVAFGRSVEGIDYESLDGKPSHLFFMIAAPEGGEQMHLEALARLSSMLMDASFRAQLETASSEEEIIRLVAAKESEQEAPQQAVQAGNGRKVLAVTACPTGIAHTYMAADALKAKAAEMGVSIKVETNGSDGVKNALTAQEISPHRRLKKPRRSLSQPINKSTWTVLTGNLSSKCRSLVRSASRRSSSSRRSAKTRRFIGQAVRRGAAWGRRNRAPVFTSI